MGIPADVPEPRRGDAESAGWAQAPSEAASFDAVAGVYAVARPSYPREVVEWVLSGNPEVVADVGAGTGLFTRLLTGPGRAVVAVEPSALMLAVLKREVPGVLALAGSGEQLPLADDSVDLIVFAQAWHWVDSAAASTEAERALRPGGELVLLWNLRDERVPWVRALGEAMRADGDHFRGDPDLPSVGAEFGEPESFTNEWVREVTLPQLLDDVRSRSYFALLSQAEQGAVLDSVTRVAEGATDASGTMELPYVTAAYRYAPAD